VRAYRSTNNVIDGAVVTFVDITERKLHEQDRSRLAAIVESSKDAIISYDLDGIINSWNRGAEDLYGYSASKALGQAVSLLLGGDLPDGWPQLQARLEEGEQMADVDRFRIAKDGRRIDVSLTISPVREGDGRIVGASLVARDISERKAAEQKAALLMGELDHRVKNILAIVSAVVSQTLKGGTSPEKFAADVESRVEAIAKAHSLLTQDRHGEMSLRDIITTELAPYDLGSGRFTYTGRDIALTPRAGLAIAMAIHELASNAAKYGALSTTSGRLAVLSEIGGDAGGGSLTVSWTESGGPVVQPPTRRGFGTTLIERALTHELDAKVERAFLPSGVRCTIILPLTDNVGHMQDGSERGQG
jgi:two-component system CheB/CheR fusion protein